jgi:UDP-N-acetylmuramyl tripeptide synthase
LASGGSPVDLGPGNDSVGAVAEPRESEMTDNKLPLRAKVATTLSRGAAALSRATGRGDGAVIGGKIGMMIDPNLLANLAAGREIALISGTNGKTTTTRLTAAAMSVLGPVATNSLGANMPTGHASALAKAGSTPYAVLEVDEHYLRQVLNATHPRVVALLNLSRDQLDRAKEVAMMAALWRDALREASADSGPASGAAGEAAAAASADSTQSAASAMAVPTPANGPAASADSTQSAASAMAVPTPANGPAPSAADPAGSAPSAASSAGGTATPGSTQSAPAPASAVAPPSTSSAAAVAGPRNAGHPDAGPRDAGLRDTGPRNAGHPDAGLRDAGRHDGGLHVVANADDPMVTWAASTAKEVTWVAAGQRWHDDSWVCPECGSHIERSGDDWWCVTGDLRRPEPQWRVTEDGVIDPSGTVHRVELQLPGRVNKANAATALAVAAYFGVRVEDAIPHLAQVASIAGRYATVVRDQRTIRLLLAKNPAGWLEAFDMAEDTPTLLSINARDPDGLDTSWLYDVDFSPLRGRRVLVTGDRAMDLAVRLEVNEVPFEHVTSFDKALKAIPPGRLEVIANYTAFQDIRAELDRVN